MSDPSPEPHTRPRGLAKDTDALPTGTVTFLDGGNAVGSAPLDNGTATVEVTTLGVGDHQLTASYGGRCDNQVATVVKLSFDVDDLDPIRVLARRIFLQQLQAAVRLDGIDRNRARLLTAHHHELSVRVDAEAARLLFDRRAREER